eukprot:TRINITY_DN18498_c0_g1_i1.p1 TRINITY_DN18498_c0_g1~~TRINITY_DN18498_c0_g1_i1.p1  ORF type:complete len:444 (+),score=122.14 TRINITY_DN18498_c0_g1_i1:166-1497(+)
MSDCEGSSRRQSLNRSVGKEEGIGELAEPLLDMDAPQATRSPGGASDDGRLGDNVPLLGSGESAGSGTLSQTQTQTAAPARSRLSLSTRLSFLSNRGPPAVSIDLPHSASPHFEATSRFESVVDSVRAAIEEGNKLPELVVAGSSGSYWVFDRTGKRVGIFKPKSEEPYGPANPKWGKWLHRVMCPCCFGRSCLLPNTGYLSEAAAFAMDVLLDLRVVPPTSIVHLAAKTFNYNAIERRLSRLPIKMGSLQLLVECNGDGRTVNPDSMKDDQRTALLDEFQRLVCLDYMTRNTDRGLDNWLTHTSNTGSQVKVHAIDNGLAFPYKHPDNWRTYPPSWSSHPLGKQAFTAAIRELVLEKLNAPSWMSKAEKKMRDIMFRDEIMTESLFQGQMAVIRGQRQNLIECLTKDGSTPEQLFNKHPLYIVRKPTGMIGWKTHLPCFSCC